MPVTAKELIEGRQVPAMVQDGDLVATALRVMIERDYSQLPIVDDGMHPQGLITADSILKAMDNFGVSADKLRVRDAATKHISYTFEVNVFDLLDSLSMTPAILLIDEENRLEGIITNWDMAQYFRERSQDLMLVKDIETALKDHIQASFAAAPSGDGDGDLQEAIDIVANAPAVSTVETAIRKYVSQVAGKQKPDVEALTKVREGFFKIGKTLDDLTLYQLTELLLYPPRWQNYQSHFILGDTALRTMLEKVQHIRNTLAHFRDELTPLQRESLRFCADWFDRNPPDFPETDTEDVIPGQEEVVFEDESIIDPFALSPETLVDSKSRFARLAQYLHHESSERVRLTFDEIEGIIEGSLPPSAHSHRSWWANNIMDQPQSQYWLNMGWRVAGVNITEGIITFVRAGERERSYIYFFGALLREYVQIADYPIKTGSPSGASWHTVGAFRTNGEAVANLTFSFARASLFRVELYIDSKDAKMNKHLFDVLHAQREEFEVRLRDELSQMDESSITGPLKEKMRVSWQRLESRRASRIAIVIRGSVNDEFEDWIALFFWGSQTMVAFQHVLTPLLAEMGYTYSDK